MYVYIYNNVYIAIKADRSTVFWHLIGPTYQKRIQHIANLGDFRQGERFQLWHKLVAMREPKLNG